MKPRIAFVIEQALGHVAYGQALRKALAARDDIEQVWIEVPFDAHGFGKLPVVRNNWTVRGSLEARRRILAAERARRFDVLFLHTQTISLFAGGLMRRIPTLLSLDATPVNLDELAECYGHRRQARPIEALKRRLITRAMSRAASYTTWSNWTKDSLQSHYGVDPALVTVVHPGATLDETPARTQWHARDRKLQLLFVGGDFQRKGGDLLLAVFERSLRDTCELHVVTGSDVRQSGGVHVYRGLRPHSDQLRALYANADVFVLPTRGDCLAVVLGEAMAASLPIITTSVGAHAEAIEHERSGFLVDVEDVCGLRDALLSLVADRGLVERMGRRSRAIGEQRFNMATGAARLLDILLDLSRGTREGSAHHQPAVAQQERAI